MNKRINSLDEIATLDERLQRLIQNINIMDKGYSEEEIISIINYIITFGNEIQADSYSPNNTNDSVKENEGLSKSDIESSLEDELNKVDDEQSKNDTEEEKEVNSPADSTDESEQSSEANDEDNSNDSSSEEEKIEYEVTQPFFIDFNDLDTITIKDLDIDEKLANKIEKTEKQIRVLEELKQRKPKSDSLKDSTDKELNRRLTEIINDYRKYSELEYDNIPNYINEAKEIEEELARRNKYKDNSDEELKRMIEQTKKAYSEYSDGEYETVPNLINQLRELEEELARRNNSNDSFNSKEIEGEIAELKSLLSNLNKMKEAYEEDKKFLKRYQSAIDEQERRKNPFYRKTNEELNAELEKIQDEYAERIQNANDNTELLNRHNEIIAELKRRENQPTDDNNEFSNYTDEELEEEINDMYQFRAHEENGLEGYEIDLSDNDEDIRQVYVNGERTNNIEIKKGFKFSNGDYVSIEELQDAIDEEFSSLRENEVVICKRTGEKISSPEEIMNAIIEAAKEDSRIQLKESNEDLGYPNRNISLNDVNVKDDKFEDMGNIRMPNDDIPEDYFIRTNIVKNILSQFEKGKAKTPSEPTSGGPREPGGPGGPSDPTGPEGPNDPSNYNNEELERLFRDMLDRYYGNKKREKLYRKYMQLYKSHIVKDKDGFMTVEDFPEKALIEKEFHLEEYKDRLEAYSRYQQGDNSRYIEQLNLYKNIGFEFPKKADGSLFTDEEKINMLIAEDAHYIETFNENYNSYENTFLNLKTLGKDGEKKPYAHLDKVQDKNGKTRYKISLANAGKIVLNTGIGAMNIFKVYPARFIGTYIAAPVQHLIHNSDKKAAGAYTNKATHRYAQRRDYFEKLYLQKLQEKYAAQGLNFNELKLSDRIKMTWSARYNALVKYKKGNAKVLELGAAHIKASEAEKKQLNELKEKRLKELENEKNNLNNRLKFINEQKNKVEGKEKEDLEKEEETIASKLREVLKKTETIKNSTIIRGFITNQTDAISLETHDKANKDNITHVVHGVKIVGKVVLAKVLIPKLVEKITTQKEVVIPGKTYTVKTSEGDPNKIMNLKMNDLVEAGDKSQLHYDALHQVPQTTGFSQDYVRGLHFKWKGHYYSGTDGVGYNVFPNNGVNISTVQLPSTISGDTNVCEAIAKTLNQCGVPVTPMEVAQEIAKNPTAFFNEYDTWLSPSSFGMAAGWQDGYVVSPLDIFKFVTKKAPDVHKVITKTKEVINAGVAAGLSALGLDTLADLYDDARRTQSQKENIEVGASKKNPNEIPETQKSPKAMNINIDEANLYGFTGDRKSDLDKFSNDSEDEEEKGKSR